jgi:hypothetical protein
VVAFDRAVVGRVSISYDKLDSTDPREFLRKPTIGLYLGRLGLAILFAAIITEPLMLARYQGEIDARLNEVHNQQLSLIDTNGVIATWTARLDQLKRETEADDAAVRYLTTRASQKRQDARLLYQQAVDDSAGAGVTSSTSRPARCSAPSGPAARPATPSRPGSPARSATSGWSTTGRSRPTPGSARAPPPCGTW